MSTSPGPRGSRASTRSRGSARASSRGKVSGNSTARSQATRAAASTVERNNNIQGRLRPPNQQGKNGNRKDGKGEQLSSAILSHAGKISRTRDQPWRNAAEQDSNTYKQRMSDLYQTLKDSRERERKKAIKDGFLADPDKPTILANAITPVGTCQDMCPEFERVERIVQLMVDANEKMPSVSDADLKVPCEELMVKRFRRSAAGYDEQLPSDIRPPVVLQTTLNHLFDSVIGGPEPLATTHKFVWDRTRGIRNDFSIQQVTKVEDLKIAIDCFERIARFHILSLHQLSHPDKDNGEFDHHQEREQLNNTLLSLMYYYDDSRHKLKSPNEPEFRAYCVIFEIQDQRPDLEDRAQNWPGTVLKDARVKTALKLYAAAGNTSDEQGPLRPRTAFSIAQANPRGFFELVQSNSVPYIMACVAEIYFNLVRAFGLESIWKAYKGKRPGAAKVEDWVLEDIMYALGFDNLDQARTFCEEHEFEVSEREDAEEYVNLGSVAGSPLKDNNPRRKQIFSRYLVESKRLGRSLTAVINGLGVAAAQAQGLVDDTDADIASVADSESLFVNGDAERNKISPRSRSTSPLPPPTVTVSAATKVNGTSSSFNSTNFGLPSSKPNPFKPVQSDHTPNQTKAISSSVPGGQTSSQAAKPFTPGEPPPFNFSPFSNGSKQIMKETSNASDGIKTSNASDSPPINANNVQGRNPEAVLPTVNEQHTRDVVTFGLPPMGATAGTRSAPETSHSKQGQAPIAPNLSSGTPLLFTRDKSVPEAINMPNFIQNNIEPSPSLQLQPVGISLPTEQATSITSSPLSQPMASKTHVETQASPFHPSTSIHPNHPSFNTTFSKPPSPNPFVPANLDNISPIQPSPKKSDPFSKHPFQSLSGGSTHSFPSAFQSSTLQASDHSDPIPSQQPSRPSVFSAAPASPAIPATPVPHQQRTQSNVPASNPAISGNNSISSASTQFAPPSSPPKPALPNPRPAALDKVTDGLVFDNGGLLQQYIEMTIAPIMRSAIAQFEDEESWREAKSHRVALLARKYLQRWKHNAWRLGVVRRGRRQRQNLARSMQDLAKKRQATSEEPKRPAIFNTVRFDEVEETAAVRNIDNMPPPEVPKQKRQSLPSNFSEGIEGVVQTPKSSKRKLDDANLNNTASPSQPRAYGHKRSNTAGFTGNENSIMSAPPHRPWRFRQQQSMNGPKRADDTVSSDALAKQARRMISEARLDTTKTDYFQLKALGIDPDTPPIPHTIKANARSGNQNATSVASERDPKAQLTTSRTTQQPTSQISQNRALVHNDDDDEFFASIRAIRSTLADSTSWFQSERESIERSMTPSHASGSPPSSRQETAAERRLREIKARGHTPTRSEIRLRAMGDKALLPEGFWDGEGMGKSLIGGQQRNASDTQHRQGFSALAHQTPQRSKMNGWNSHDSVHNPQPQQSGAMSEDVIELSD